MRRARRHPGTGLRRLPRRRTTIRPPRASRARAISRTCARCHQAHLGRLRERACTASRSLDGNADVPVCTDCHRSHDIGGAAHHRVARADAGDVRQVPHQREPLMAKYGLSTNVVSHLPRRLPRHDARRSRSTSGTAAPGGAVAALCIDCHGVHDITARRRDPQSPVLKANLVADMPQVPPGGAPTTFPAAWLSHYEPSLAEGAAGLRGQGLLRGLHPVHDRRPRVSRSCFTSGGWW